MSSIKEAASYLFEKKYKRTFKTYAIWITAFNFLALIVLLNSPPDSALFIWTVLFGPWVILVYLYRRKENEARAIFWQWFAEDRSWRYAAVGDRAIEKAKMFKQGSDLNVIKNYITGKIENRRIRIFEYDIVIKGQDTNITHPYTVFAFKFAGKFPHIFLNYRDDDYSIRFSNKLPVPLEFEKDFHLYAPRKYEIEALAIFTPDLFHFILEENWSCDIELIDRELIIFRPGYIKDRAELEKEFGKALALVEKIAPNLDKARFEKIGDYAHTLS